jgi:starch synthase
MHIIMAAAENGALPGAKVGGIGDVIRDVPRALAERGHQVSVILPGYQKLSRLPGAHYLLSLTIEFVSSLHTIDVFEIKVPGEHDGVRHYVLENPLFAVCGEGQLYCHDVEEPFASDASKFSMFSLAVCHLLATEGVGKPDILHLHDWHTAPILLLRAYHPGFAGLRDIPTVFTIHNLSLQGIRPLDDNWSSLLHWFPGLAFNKSKIVDSRYPDCVNLMRCGINLADKVHVVSPHYAEEIVQPSDPARGLVRGEGLELDLQRAQEDGRLFGILNGCDYPASARGRKPTRAAFINEAKGALDAWVGDKARISAAHYHAHKQLVAWETQKQKDNFMVTSVGRLTPQKVSLLQVEVDGTSALDLMLKLLTAEKGFMVTLGSGDPACEAFMTEVMRRNTNFLFLNGYAEKTGELLYRMGDLFLMPSTFEPCGISQMVAMRAGTPCLVHETGGLADTVKHMLNGFSFSGDNPQEQAKAMIRTFAEVLQIYSSRMPQWQQIEKAAAAARFRWDEVAADYETLLYSFPDQVV